MQLLCNLCKVDLFLSNISFIRATNCKIFIHYIHLLCFSYMFRFYIHHHQGQIMCPLLKTTCSYAALKYGYYNNYVVNYERNNLSVCGPGSLSPYSDWLRARRSGFESRWGRDFPPVQTGPGAHPASCKMGTGSFPGVKCGQGVLLTTHPLLVPRSWKSRAITLPIFWATPGL